MYMDILPVLNSNWSAPAIKIREKKSYRTFVIFVVVLYN